MNRHLLSHSPLPHQILAISINEFPIINIQVRTNLNNVSYLIQFSISSLVNLHITPFSEYGCNLLPNIPSSPNTEGFRISLEHVGQTGEEENLIPVMEVRFKPKAESLSFFFLTQLGFKGRPKQLILSMAHGSYASNGKMLKYLPRFKLSLVSVISVSLLFFFK